MEDLRKPTLMISASTTLYAIDAAMVAFGDGAISFAVLHSVVAFSAAVLFAILCWKRKAKFHTYRVL